MGYLICCSLLGDTRINSCAVSKGVNTNGYRRRAWIQHSGTWINGICSTCNTCKKRASSWIYKYLVGQCIIAHIGYGCNGWCGRINRRNSHCPGNRAIYNTGCSNNRIYNGGLCAQGNGWANNGIL